MVEPTLPVIFLAIADSTIKGYDELPALRKEADSLRTLFDQAHQRGICELVVRENVTTQHITDVFQDYRYHNRIAIFHFAGHGDAYSLLLQNAQYRPILPGVDWFTSLLAEQQNVELVFLNACVTGEHARGLHDAGVSNTITTNGYPNDDWCTIFATRFYTGLVNGASIDSAFNIARHDLQIEDSRSAPDLWELSKKTAGQPPWRIGTNRQLGPQYPYIDFTYFQRRAYLEQRVEEFLTSRDKGYFILTAKAGMGKTTFLARLAGQSNERCAIVAHFGEDVRESLTVAYTELSQKLVERWALRSYPNKVSSLQEFGDYIRSAAGKRDQLEPDTKIVIVLDGLDQIILSTGTRFIELPKWLPAGVFFICGTRPGVVEFSKIDEQKTLQPMEEDWACWQENLLCIRSYIQQRLANSDIGAAIKSGDLSHDEVIELIAQRSEGVWLYLKFLFDQLTDTAEKLRAREPVYDPSVKPLDIEELPQGWLEKCTEIFSQLYSRAGDEWHSNHLKLLALLAAVRAPLTRNLISLVYPDLDHLRVTKIIRQLWLPIVFVDNSDPANPAYRYYHTSFRDFVSGAWGWEESNGYWAEHRRVVKSLTAATIQAHSDISSSYFLAWGEPSFEGLAGEVPESPATEYGIENLLYHLVMSGRYDDLFHIGQGGFPTASSETRTDRYRPWRILTRFWYHGQKVGVASSQIQNPWFSMRKRRNELAKFVYDLSYMESTFRKLVANADGEVDGKERWFQYAISTMVTLSSIRVLLSEIPPTLAATLWRNSLCDIDNALLLTDNLADAKSRDDALELIARYCTEAKRYDEVSQIVYRISSRRKKLSVLVLLAQVVEPQSPRNTQIMLRIFSLLGGYEAVHSAVSLPEVFRVCAPLMHPQVVSNAVKVVEKSATKDELPKALAYLLKEVMVAGSLEEAITIAGAINGIATRNELYKILAVELAIAGQLVNAWRIITYISGSEAQRSTIIQCARYALPDSLGEDFWLLLQNQTPAQQARTVAAVVAGVPFEIENESHVENFLRAIGNEPSVRYQVRYLMVVISKVTPDLRHKVDSVLEDVIAKKDLLSIHKAYDLWADQPLYKLPPTLRIKCITSVGESVRFKFERIMSLSDYEVTYRPNRVVDRILHRRFGYSNIDVSPKIMEICKWIERLLVNGLIGETVTIIYALVREYRYAGDNIVFLRNRVLTTLATYTDRISRAVIEGDTGAGALIHHVYDLILLDEDLRLLLSLIESLAYTPQERSKYLAHVMNSSQFASMDAQFIIATAALIRTLPEDDLSGAIELLVNSAIARRANTRLSETAREVHKVFSGMHEAQMLLEAKLLAITKQYQTAVVATEYYDLLVAISDFGHPIAATQAVYAALELVPPPTTQGTTPARREQYRAADPELFLRLLKLGAQEDAFNLAVRYLDEWSLYRFLEHAVHSVTISENDRLSDTVFQLIKNIPVRSYRESILNRYIPQFSTATLKGYDPLHQWIGDANSVAFAEVMLDFSSLLIGFRQESATPAESIFAFFADRKVTVKEFQFMVRLLAIVERELRDPISVCRSLVKVVNGTFRGVDYIDVMSDVAACLHPDRAAYSDIFRGAAANANVLLEAEWTTSRQKALNLVLRERENSDARNADGSKRILHMIFPRDTSRLWREYSELLLDVRCTTNPVPAQEVCARYKRIRDTGSTRFSMNNLSWAIQIMVAAISRLHGKPVEQLPIVNTLNEIWHEFGPSISGIVDWQFQELFFDALAEMSQCCPAVNVEIALSELVNSAPSGNSYDAEFRAKSLIILAGAHQLDAQRRNALISRAQAMYGTSHVFYISWASRLHSYSPSAKEEACSRIIGWLQAAQEQNFVKTILASVLRHLSTSSQITDAIRLLTSIKVDAGTDLSDMILSLATSMYRTGYSASDTLSFLRHYSSSRDTLMSVIAGIALLLSSTSDDNRGAFRVHAAIRNAVHWWP